MPKIVNRKKKQEKILQAALTVFAQKGYEATKIADIARQAGIGKGTIYEYYRSKKEIFNQLFRFMFSDFDRQFEQRIAEVSSPVEKIKLIIQIYFVDVVHRYGDFSKVVMNFWMKEALSAQSDETSAINLLEIYTKYAQLTASFINEGIEQKLFRPVNAQHYAAMLIGIFDGLYLQMFLKVNQFKPEEMAQSILDLFLTGLTNPNYAGKNHESTN
jgi:TetR/AcrR family fatty acid metabolism transcriptional regulator